MSLPKPKPSEMVKQLFGDTTVTLFYKQDGKQKAAVANRVSDKFLIVLEVSDDSPQGLLDKLELELQAWELMKIPDWLTKAVAELLGEKVTIHYSNVSNRSAYTLQNEHGRVMLSVEEATQSRAALELNSRLRALLEASRAVSRPSA